MTTGRVPPNDQNAERAVLGGVLLENEALSVVSELPLRPGDFYRDAHNLIFEAMLALFREGKPVDTVTLRERLVAASQLERVGGDEYLLALTDTIPTVDNIEAHARIVLDYALRRHVITVAHQIASEGYEPIENAQDFAERSARDLAELTERGSSRVQSISLADAVNEEYPLLQKRHESGETVLGHRTGFKKLDEQLSGLVPGDLIFVGARPGMGKTAFANALKIGVADSTGMQVLGIELEMLRQQLVHRLWSAESSINMRFIRGADLNQEDFQLISQASERLARLPIELLFNRNLRLSQLISWVRMRRRKYGPIGAVVVDYLQRLRPDATPRSRDQNRDEQIGVFTDALKTLAGEMNCPVVALSALNRAVESRPDKRPQLSDLHGSGAIESDADTVLFLYRDAVYFPSKPENQKPENRGLTEIIIGKQRSGEMATVKVRFASEFVRFEELEREVNERQQGMAYG